jgi:hypothetical protein
LLLGFQCGQAVKAAQNQQLVELADIAIPAAQQFAAGGGVAGVSLYVLRGLGGGAKGQGEGGEFVVHGVSLRWCSEC